MAQIEDLAVNVGCVDYVEFSRHGKQIRLWFDFHDNGTVSAPGEVVRKCIKAGMVRIFIQDPDPRFDHEIPVASLTLREIKPGKHYLLNKVERITKH